MDKKYLLIAILLMAAIGLFFLVRELQNVQTQILREKESVNPQEVTDYRDCQIFSEQVANDCYQRLAIEEKDEDICEEISIPSLVTRCKREVELSP